MKTNTLGLGLGFRVLAFRTPETEEEVQESTKELTTTENFILPRVLEVIQKRSNTMSGFLKALLCVVLVKTLVNSTVLTKSGTDDARKLPCNVNNYFYAGPNTKKIEQQLAEIREEIKALKQNRTSGSGSSGKGLQYFLKHPSFRAVFPAFRRSSVPCVSD